MIDTNCLYDQRSMEALKWVEHFWKKNMVHIPLWQIEAVSPAFFKIFM